LATKIIKTFSMKKIILAVLILSASYSRTSAQSLPPMTCGIVYTYDDAGNRTQRQYLCNNSPYAVTPGKLVVIKEEETSLVKQVSTLYPNPTTGQFVIGFTKPLNQAQITLVDAGGRVLLQRKVSGSRVDFDASHFAAGVYQLQINDGGNIIVQKVVKQ